MKYLQVCHALYNYQARTSDEINIKENDILYIISMDDDDWWKAEIKQASNEHTGSIGLVPATYLEEVSPIGKVRAEYDYDARQEEEVSFGEGQELRLLEQDDPDWYLVKLENGDIGLAPSNYIQIIGAAIRQQQQQVETPATVEPTAAPTYSNIALAPPQHSNQLQRSANDNHDEAQSWSVHEYDVAKKKRKKGKGSLLVGNAMLCYGSETDKTSPVQQYPILDVSKYLINGKNLHIEINGSNPAVLDLQVSSKSEAKAILVKITDSRKTAQLTITRGSQQRLKTPANNNMTVLSDDNNNSNNNNIIISKGSGSGESRWATSLYAFKAEGGEEISIGENEQILVTAYKRDDGWWRVETVNGKSGIIPSSYIQFHHGNDSNGGAKDHDQLPEQVATGDDGVDNAASDEVEAYMRRRQEQQKDSHRHKEEQKYKIEQQARNEQEQERRRRIKEAAQFAEATRQQHMEDERIRREANTRSSSMSPDTSHNLSCSTSAPQNLSQPDPNKLRTWTDRSGSFRVEAQFLGYANGKLRLHKANGVKIDVPLEKMSAEDIRWVERRTDQPVGSITKRLRQEKLTPDMPPCLNPTTFTEQQRQQQRDKTGLAKGRKTTNSNWDWFDWFMKIGIPMQEALIYSSAFTADNLDDSDLTQLTHKQMKMLGMKENHVQRMERYIDTGNVELPSDNEEANNTGQRDLTRHQQIETDEQMARRLQESLNENGRNEMPSSSTTTTKPAQVPQSDIHPDILDFLGSGSAPINKEQSIKDISDEHSALFEFSDDAWALRPVKDINQSQNQQTQPIQQISPQHVVSSTAMTSQQPLSMPTSSHLQATEDSAPTRPATLTASLQQPKTIDTNLLIWQSSSTSHKASQSAIHNQSSLNELSQQEQLRKYQQQQRQQSLLDQQQQIIMQQQQQIQQQQIHQQQIQLQQQQQQQQQNQQLQQTTGYPQPNHLNNLVIRNQGSAETALQQPLPHQITGYMQQDQMTGYIPRQQLIQPTATSSTGQSVYPQLTQAPSAQVSTGYDWNFSTPDNPFGSPSGIATQMTSTGVHLSTPNLDAFTRNPPMQSSTSLAYLQQLQPQMTGIQQTELSGARDKYAAFRTPNMDVFTQSGSMQHAQSVFPQSTQQYGQH